MQIDRQKDSQPRPVLVLVVLLALVYSFNVAYNVRVIVAFQVPNLQSGYCDVLLQPDPPRPPTMTLMLFLIRHFASVFRFQSHSPLPSTLLTEESTKRTATIDFIPRGIGVRTGAVSVSVSVSCCLVFVVGFGFGFIIIASWVYVTAGAGRVT
jgi:hypothetical protein